MPEKKPLRIMTAFGPTRAKALILAAHPDEHRLPSGDPSPHRRTLVLELRGDQAVFVEEQPMPLARAWYSSGSGVGYCTSVATDKLYKWQAGRWTEEVFSETPVAFVRFIFGLPGATPAEDILFLATQKGLFTRTAAGWKLHTAAKGFPYQVHGREPSQVYVGGEKLFKWTGTKLVRVEDPDDDTVSSLWVTDDDRLIGGNTYLSITTADGGWQRIPMPTKDYGALTELDGIIYAATTEHGVAQVWPAPHGPVTPPFRVLAFANLGDAILASGDARQLVGDGKRWDAFDVPACELGKKP